jgi:anti-sigma factor RsiW
MAMLPDRDRELLAASVDGELGSRQRHRVARLLERSEEARRFLDSMQQDAQVLRALAPPRLNEDLSGSVLRTIAEHCLVPSLSADRANGTARS